MICQSRLYHVKRLNESCYQKLTQANEITLLAFNTPLGFQDWLLVKKECPCLDNIACVCVVWETERAETTLQSENS